MSSNTLRNWERRFGFIVPTRADNDFRLYSVQDVELIKRIAAHLAGGKRLREIAELLRAGATLSASDETPPTSEWSGLIDDLYRAMAAFRFDRTEHLTSVLAASLTPSQMVERVYEPILRRVRSDNDALRISASQEHFITAAIRFRLCALANAFESPASSSRRCVLAALTSERHEGRVLILTCLLKLRGRAVMYLGVNVLIEHLAQLDRSMQNLVFCVVVSNSFLASKTLHRLKVFKNPIIVISEDAESPSSVPAGFSVIAGQAVEVVRRVETIVL